MASVITDCGFNIVLVAGNHAMATTILVISLELKKLLLLQSISLDSLVGRQGRTYHDAHGQRENVAGDLYEARPNSRRKWQRRKNGSPATTLRLANRHLRLGNSFWSAS